MDGRYLGARVGQALLVLWASFTVSFVLLQLLPGDAIAIKFQNPELGLNAAQIAQMRTAYGADERCGGNTWKASAARCVVISAFPFRRAYR